MAKWILLGTPCLACLTFLAAGALSRPTPTVAATPPDPFLAQPLPPDDARALDDADGPRVLGRSLASLREARWLSVTIWQKLHDAADGYESETRLTLGPDHCARMETTLRAGAGVCKLLVVSDGHTLAETLRWPGAAPQVTSAYLPSPAGSVQREQFLRKRGCVGPHALLTELRDLRPAWRLETGIWRERPVIRLEAPLEAHGMQSAGHANVAARSCRLYLNAASMWPMRLEWYRGVEPQHAQLLLEIEFRDPELNRELSREECARVFSYQP